VPLVRTPRALPRILEPVRVDALLAAVRMWRDRAMAEAMVLGGLRRCEVLGLRLEDLRVGQRRVFIAEGKGGHQRLIPISGRLFTSVAAYLDIERPADAGTDRLFVVLKGPRRGRPLSPAGLDQILESARARAGLTQATCHQLRHTCLTRLREAGMGFRSALRLALAPIESCHGGVEELVESLPTWARSFASSASNPANRSALAADSSASAANSPTSPPFNPASVALNASISPSLASTTCRSRAFATRSRATSPRGSAPPAGSGTNRQTSLQRRHRQPDTPPHLNQTREMDTEYGPANQSGCSPGGRLGHASRFMSDRSVTLRA
jgi:hypothetical protein